MACLVVGSIAFDSIQTPKRSVTRVIGGSATYFANAARHLSVVNVVGVIGEDFTDDHLAVFKDSQIDISGIYRQSGKTFFWSGRYNDDLSQAETLLTELNVFGDFNPKIPEAFIASDTVFLGNIDPGLQMSVLDAVKEPRLVACEEYREKQP